VHGSAVVLVVGEAAIDGSPRPIAWEMLTAAREIAGVLGENCTVTGLFFGAGVSEAAHTWATGGAD
jgi:hypothetical protein